MSKLTPQQVSTIQRLVLDWFTDNGRHLPWRRTDDPYKILVSEIMLQQTQVSRVVPKYEEFLTTFPNVTDLASASPAEVITVWRGLGYNRRALNLQRAAQIIVGQYGGTVPSDLEALRTLPGIGRYTAGAVMNFAFGIDTPAVDTNVKQFFDHFVPSRSPRSENDYYMLAEQFIPKGKAKIWLHAVMDYSSLVIRPTRPRSRKKRTPSEPFVGSNRYLRGQTLEYLRNAPQTLNELFTRIAAPIDVERDRYESLILALGVEGFIERRDSLIQLRR